MSQPFTVPFRSAKVVIVPSLSKASPFLTGPVWPLSVASTAWLAASLVASGNSNAVRSIFTTLKSSERGGSMLRLCCQWTFTPRNLLGIGRDWKNGWMFAVCLHTLRWAPSNHVVCIRCLWWSWEWTRVVSSRTPRKACKQNLLPRNARRNQVGSNTFVGLSVVGQLGWW